VASAASILGNISGSASNLTGCVLTPRRDSLLARFLLFVGWCQMANKDLDSRAKRSDADRSYDAEMHLRAFDRSPGCDECGAAEKSSTVSRGGRIVVLCRRCKGESSAQSAFPQIRTDPVRGLISRSF
jgi:hypothetical protein